MRCIRLACGGRPAGLCHGHSLAEVTTPLSPGPCSIRRVSFWAGFACPGPSRQGVQIQRFFDAEGGKKDLLEAKMIKFTNVFFPFKNAIKLKCPRIKFRGATKSKKAHMKVHGRKHGMITFTSDPESFLKKQQINAVEYSGIQLTKYPPPIRAALIMRSALMSALQRGPKLPP